MNEKQAVMSIVEAEKLNAVIEKIAHAIEKEELHILRIVAGLSRDNEYLSNDSLRLIEIADSLRHQAKKARENKIPIDMQF